MINGGRIHPYARHHKHHMQGGGFVETVGALPAAASAILGGLSAANYLYQQYANGGQETPQTAHNAKVIRELSDPLHKHFKHDAAGLASDLAQKSYLTTGEPVQKKDFGLPTLSLYAPPPLVGRSNRPPFTPKALHDKRPGRARFKRSLKPLHSSSSSKSSKPTKKAGSKKRKKVRRKGGALINNTGADNHPSAHGYNWTSVQH